jgi:hypothetical protein
MYQVPVQKGPIQADQKTFQMMTHRDLVAEAEKDYRERKDGQTLRLMTPSTGRKSR